MSQNKVFVVTGQDLSWQAIVVDHLTDGTNLNGKLIPLCYTDKIDVVDVLDAFYYNVDQAIIVPVEYVGTVHEYLDSISSVLYVVNEVKTPSGNVADVTFKTNVDKYDDVFKEHRMNDDVPSAGDEIYVDHQRTAFTNIIGGKAKVAQVHATKPTVDKDSDDEGQYVVTYFLEVEELPGVFLNWSLLIQKQAQLKEQFGNQYASINND